MILYDISVLIIICIIVVIFIIFLPGVKGYYDLHKKYPHIVSIFDSIETTKNMYPKNAEWEQYGNIKKLPVYIEKKIYIENITLELFNILHNIKGIQNAYFLKLAPETRMTERQDNTNDILKVIYTIFSTSSGDQAYISVNDYMRPLKYLSKYLYDPKYKYSITNNSYEDIIVLIIDLKKD